MEVKWKLDGNSPPYRNFSLDQDKDDSFIKEQRKLNGQMKIPKPEDLEKLRQSLQDILEDLKNNSKSS